MTIPTKYQAIALTYFKDRLGNPFRLTSKQSEIFRLVYEPQIMRAAIKTVTQYGKSDVSSMAIIMMAVIRREKILIVSPSIKQSSIIMEYVIAHLFDDEDLTAMIAYEGSLERLKQERSKHRITFRNGSEIYILTADADTVSKEGKGLMGFGATVVIVDESSLIPDIMFSKILRMLGGVPTGKLIQLGNPFEKNHFYRSFFNPRYEKLSVNYQVAIAEGRMTKEFVEEAREEMPPMDFTIFYECEFPEGGAEDSLIPYDWIMLAVNQQNIGGEKTQAGLDVARFGRDKSVFTPRIGGRVIDQIVVQHQDTMKVAGWASGLIKVYKPEVTAVDVVGLGAGVYDRLDELGFSVYPVNAGEAPMTEEGKEKYFNLRAEMYWTLREQFRPEGQGVNRRSMIGIPNDKELINDLVETRYKYSSERKIRIEDKEDMKKRIGRSPDKADSLAFAYMDLTANEPGLIIV